MKNEKKIIALTVRSSGRRSLAVVLAGLRSAIGSAIGTAITCDRIGQF
jgi:hypothetical protein